MSFFRCGLQNWNLHSLTSQICRLYAVFYLWSSDWHSGKPLAMTSLLLSHPGYLMAPYFLRFQHVCEVVSC